jgi:hypothetical protein
MAEKCLTESDWKNFARSNKLDDSKLASKDTKALHEAVLEALQELARKDENKSEEMLPALDRFEGLITRQIAANAKRKDKDGKAIKDTKDVKDQLYKMLAAVDKQRKEVTAARDAKAAADDEPESPALLTTKMAPLIREVRNGKLVLQALVALAAKETVVLVSRTAISPARGKLLKDQMSNPAGLKFVRGECLFEANALTFVVQAGASGLARRIKEALLTQISMRLKVRVRGENPADIDQDGEDDTGTAAAPDDARAAAPAAPAGGQPPPPPDAARLAFAKRLLALKVQVDKAVAGGAAQAEPWLARLESARQKVKDGDVPGGDAELGALEALLAAQAKGPQGPGGPAAVEAGVAFKARLTALLPRVKAAQGTGSQAALDAKLMASQAGVLAGKKDFAQANALLDALEELLSQPAVAVSAAAPASTASPAAPASADAQATALAQWQAARGAVVAQLGKLCNAIKATRDPQANPAIILVRAIQANLSTEPDSLRSVAELERYLRTDDIIDEAESPNGFGIQVSIREPLLGALDVLKQQLRA